MFNQVIQSVHHFQGQCIRIYNFMQICNTFIDILNKEFDAVNITHLSSAQENKCILLKKKKVFVLQPTYVSTYINYVEITPCFLPYNLSCCRNIHVVF